MKTKTILYAAAVLLPMFASAAEYKNNSGITSDPNSGEATEQLQSVIPGAADPDELKPPSPQAMEGARSAAGDGDTRRIFSENDPWHKRIAEALGIGYPCTVESKHIGKSFQATEKLTFDDGKKKESVVVKHIRAGGTGDVLQGFARRALFMGAKSPSKIKELDTPGKIFKNGIVMNKKFKAAGFKVLDIVLSDTESKDMVLVTKFLKGTDMPSILQAIPKGDAAALRLMEKYGSTLAAVHSKDLCAGDLNTGNVIFVEGEPYFIDVDLAMSGKANGWDIANVLYSHYILDGTSEPRWATETARAFLKGYLAAGGDKRIVKDALSRKYQVPLLGAMAASPNLSHRRHQARAVQIEMKKATGADPSPESDEELPAR